MKPADRTTVVVAVEVPADVSLVDQKGVLIHREPDSDAVCVLCEIERPTLFKG